MGRSVSRRRRDSAFLHTLHPTPLTGQNIGLKSWPDHPKQEEAWQLVRKLALDAFTRGVNNGKPFQDCLAIVYSSGMHIAIEGIAKIEEEETV